jgi:hypothetical protein
MHGQPSLPKSYSYCGIPTEGQEPRIVQVVKCSSPRLPEADTRRFRLGDRSSRKQVAACHTICRQKYACLPRIMHKLASLETQCLPGVILNPYIVPRCRHQQRITLIRLISDQSTRDLRRKAMHLPKLVYVVHTCEDFVRTLTLLRLHCKHPFRDL